MQEVTYTESNRIKHHLPSEKARQSPSSTYALRRPAPKSYTFRHLYLYRKRTLFGAYTPQPYTYLHLSAPSPQNPTLSLYPNGTPFGTYTPQPYTYTFRRPAPKILHLSAPTPTPQPKPTLHRSNFGVYTPTLHVNLSAPTRAASQQTTHPCETCNEQLCLLQRPSQTRPDFADEIYYIVK